jgi:hypothetical protein
MGEDLITGSRQTCPGKGRPTPITAPGPGITIRDGQAVAATGNNICTREGFDNVRSEIHTGRYVL